MEVQLLNIQCIERLRSKGHEFVVMIYRILLE